MIEIRGLVKSFQTERGDVRAVQGLDLIVHEGEFCVLLGPSGCGKTTTLRCVAGLEKPERGEIRIGSTLVNSTDTGLCVPAELRDIGMVFQSYAVWPHMTVSQNVSFPLTYGRKRVRRHLIRDKVRHVLRLVQLDGFEDRPATDLSGGQQQRVALARALVTEPQVLLMDEPFSNLDARLRQEMRAELKALTARLEITTLFVTHDQLEALTLGDTICVMERGNVLQRGTPEEIYCSPRHPFVANFVGDMNFLEGRIVRAGQVETELGTLVCHLPPSAERDASVMLAIRPEDIAFSHEPTHENNTFPGHVVGRYFLGDSINYEIRGRGVSLIARRSRSAEVLSEEVLVQLPADSLKVFPVAGTALRDRTDLNRQPDEGDNRA